MSEKKYTALDLANDLTSLMQARSELKGGPNLYVYDATDYFADGPSKRKAVFTVYVNKPGTVNFYEENLIDGFEITVRRMKKKEW